MECVATKLMQDREKRDALKDAKTALENWLSTRKTLGLSNFQPGKEVQDLLTADSEIALTGHSRDIHETLDAIIAGEDWPSRARHFIDFVNQKMVSEFAEQPDEAEAIDIVVNGAVTELKTLMANGERYLRDGLAAAAVHAAVSEAQKMEMGKSLIAADDNPSLAVEIVEGCLQVLESFLGKPIVGRHHRIPEEEAA